MKNAPPELVSCLGDGSVTELVGTVIPMFKLVVIVNLLRNGKLIATD